jgi:transcriptional regulator with XRE-family HTH domain
MKRPKRRHPLTEAVQLREIEERHRLSQQIFFRRERAGQTQDELAQRASLTQAQIANLEAGHANPTLLTIVKLASALDCPVRALFEDEARPPAGLITDERRNHKTGMQTLGLEA